MTTFVLVHGAWLGGWAWKSVAPRLREASHAVFTPTLTGLGERVHLANPEVGLDTHIQDVVNILEYEDLRQVVLVGHSYGGIVITGVADRAAERIAQLIYLDAFVPGDGQSLYDLVPEGGRRHNRELAQGDGWRIPLELQWRTGPEEQLRWMNPRWTDHPLKCFEQPVRLTKPAGAGLSRTYIRCTENVATGQLFARFASDPTWRVRELATTHTAMVTAPQALAELLLELV
ncbi:MAG: alpha/beta hydrolase [Chloroflexi bacterium]|nr:alpha/beta hydrolase [Chloroflexota bacterium]